MSVQRSSKRSIYDFWDQATNIEGSVTPLVLRQALPFGLFAYLVVRASDYFSSHFHFDLGISANPFDITGAVLGLLLVFRTNSSYDRWWEGRRLWGGIVNQSRNLGIGGLSYGPRSPRWRDDFIKWVAAYPHLCRLHLRSEGVDQSVIDLLGPEIAAQLDVSNHRPNYASTQIGFLLQEALQTEGVSQFAMMELEKQRSLLIDHIGACERILRTPLPLVYVIKIRQYLVLFLLALPFSLLHRLKSDWLIPVVTMIVAYVLLSLDQIGEELQHPFAKKSLSHLPLEDYSGNIEKNLKSLLAIPQLTESDGQGEIPGGDPIQREAILRESSVATSPAKV